MTREHSRGPCSAQGLAEVVVQGPGGTHTHALDAHLMSLADALAAEQLPRHAPPAVCML